MFLENLPIFYWLDQDISAFSLLFSLNISQWAPSKLVCRSQDEKVGKHFLQHPSV